MNKKKKKKNDLLTIIFLTLSLLVLTFSYFNIFLASLSFVLLIIVIFSIIKKQNKKLNFFKYIAIWLFVFGLFIFVFVLENLNNVFKPDNKLTILALALTPSIVYYIMNKKWRK